jgi:hypothetical protein
MLIYLTFILKAIFIYFMQLWVLTEVYIYGL